MASCGVNRLRTRRLAGLVWLDVRLHLNIVAGCGWWGWDGIRDGDDGVSTEGEG